MSDITISAITQLEGRPQIPLAQQKYRVTGRWSLAQGVQWTHSRCLLNICWDLYSPIGRWETSVLGGKKKSMGWVYSKVAKTRTSSGLFVILLFLEIPPSALLDTRVCISQTCSCLKRKQILYQEDVRLWRSICLKEQEWEKLQRKMFRREIMFAGKKLYSLQSATQPWVKKKVFWSEQT